ncbi:MAG: hypothetical protein U1A78_10735 [Polyangia bacterium]
MRTGPVPASHKLRRLLLLLVLTGLGASGCAHTTAQTPPAPADRAAAQAPAGPAAQAPAGSAPAATAAAPATAPSPAARELLLWCAAPGEPMPPPLAKALGERTTPLPGGALQAAGAAVAEARTAVAGLRCGDVLSKLDQAGDAVLGEQPLPEARAVLGELYGLMLFCADRASDRPRAEKAAAALVALQTPVPADVALVLSRYQKPPLFGPSRPPSRLETDPPGAMALRNLQPLGPTPLLVPGGRPDEDVLDVELPGMRKLRRPLGSGEQLVLALRPEDRPKVLADQIAQRPVGSDEQEAALRRLADAPLAREALPGRRVLIVGPRQRAGAPVLGEALFARAYDLDRRAWLGPLAEIPIGEGPAQAQRLLALLPPPGAAPGAAAVPPGVAAALAKPSGKAAPSGSALEKGKTGSRLPFAKTKWYTWVVAGGVVALIAGLLIAEKVSTDKVVVTATNR